MNLFFFKRNSYLLLIIKNKNRIFFIVFVDHEPVQEIYCAGLDSSYP